MHVTFRKLGSSSLWLSLYVGCVCVRACVDGDWNGGRENLVRESRIIKGFIWQAKFRFYPEAMGILGL